MGLSTYHLRHLMIALTALQISNDIERNKTISFGCHLLNEVTGGISKYGITEISGIAGSGKSQICMVLSLQCALTGIIEGTNDNVAYISCGEGLFPLRRFVELADHYAAVSGCSDSKPVSKEMLLQAVHIETCRTMEYIFEAVDKIIPSMCQKSENKIRLVIIDRYLLLSLYI